MSLEIVTTADRPDLAHTTGTWRWKAFYEGGKTQLSEVLKRDADTAGSHDLMPTVLVMLEDGQPVAMIALCLDDLEGRPDLNPWLAGLYVEPAHRGKGHALRLISEVEALARTSGIECLSLYTSNAAGLYAKAGWETVESFDRKGKTFEIMRKRL